MPPYGELETSNHLARGGGGFHATIFHACYGHKQSFHPHTPNPTPRTSHLSKGRGARVGEDLLADLATGAVGQRELEVLLEELLDVGAADAVVVLDLNNLKDLQRNNN